MLKKRLPQGTGCHQLLRAESRPPGQAAEGISLFEGKPGGTGLCPGRLRGTPRRGAGPGRAAQGGCLPRGQRRGRSGLFSLSRCRGGCHHGRAGPGPPSPCSPLPPAPRAPDLRTAPRCRQFPRPRAAGSGSGSRRFRRPQPRPRLPARRGCGVNPVLAGRARWRFARLNKSGRFDGWPRDGGRGLFRLRAGAASSARPVAFAALGGGLSRLHPPKRVRPHHCTSGLRLHIV